jgi:hypothetical protein
MTPDQRSNRMSPTFPPSRDGTACSPTATEAPEQGPNRQIQAAMIVRRSNYLSFCLRFSGQKAPMKHRHRIRRHSTPIAPAARAAA